MPLSVIKPVTEALSRAIGVPVSLLASAPAAVRREIMAATVQHGLGTVETQINYHRYLATRYDASRDSVVVLGPYRRPIDNQSDVATLDPDAAVSYTHLRAHETVLDLVCRLLLEKKKTKNTNDLTAATVLTYY